MDKITAISGGPPYHLSHHPTVLGESPLYSASSRTLHWVDFFSSPPSLHILSTVDKSNYRINSLPEIVTCIYFRADKPGSYIIGYSRGIGYLTVPGKGLKEHEDVVRLGFEVVKELIPEEDKGKLTMNDGGVDPAGRFWVTAVDLEVLHETGGAGNLPKERGRGKLWRFDGKDVKEMDRGVVVGNGMAWSVDRKTMYFNDSGTQKTYAYDFDVSTSDISNKRVLIDHSKLDFPNIKEVMCDGMVIDANSNLWIAMWAAGCLLSFSPTGEILHRVDFPAKFLTCPTWGGEDGNTLFVTSGTDEGKVSKAPKGDEGGQIFCWRGEGLKGWKKNEFVSTRGNSM